jgi:hypothetical protein
VAKPSRMARPDVLRAWPERTRRLPARGLDIAITAAITAATVGPVLLARAWWAVALALILVLGTVLLVRRDAAPHR